MRRETTRTREDVRQREEVPTAGRTPKRFDGNTSAGEYRNARHGFLDAVYAPPFGADKITGEAVYQTLLTHKFTDDELMELLAGVAFSKEAPFLLSSKIMIKTVKDGKYVLATPEWRPVPTDVTKW